MGIHYYSVMQVTWKGVKTKVGLEFKTTQTCVMSTPHSNRILNYKRSKSEEKRYSAIENLSNTSGIFHIRMGT